MTNSYILPIDSTLSGATTPAQSGPSSVGHEEVLQIPQGSSITGASSTAFLMLYPGYSLGVLPLHRDAEGVFYSHS